MIIIKDNHEPLVNLKKICPQVVVKLHWAKSKSQNIAYTRKTVARMIKKAYLHLPPGYTFIINDAWRPAHVQEQARLRFARIFAKKHPRWSNKRVRQEVNKYAAQARGKYISGHMAGGAVDLRLYKNGRKVPMRSCQLTYQENAKSNQPKLPAYLKHNRQIFFGALSKAGLSNYPREFWHWCFGDYQWARRLKRKVALYGIIKKH